MVDWAGTGGIGRGIWCELWAALDEFVCSVLLSGGEWKGWRSLERGCFHGKTVFIILYGRIIFDVKRQLDILSLPTVVL